MRGLRFPALLLAAMALGNAPRVMAADFSVCGTTVKANLEEASTPKDYQSYLGLWTGDWANGRICSGLIIKKIDGSGDAFVDYVYRPAKGSTFTSQSAIAHIENRQTLTFNDKDGSRYTFALRPGNDLPATFLSTTGTRLEASFRKSEIAVATAIQGQAPKPAPSSADERPAASDCFMGECFKDFIVLKTEKNSGVFEVKVRTETYNDPPKPGSGSAPSFETVEASCRPGNGYIQRPGRERLKEPEADPPHSTRAAKQLWEAVCGTVAASPKGVPTTALGTLKNGLTASLIALGEDTTTHTKIWAVALNGNPCAPKKVTVLSMPNMAPLNEDQSARALIFRSRKRTRSAVREKGRVCPDRPISNECRQPHPGAERVNGFCEPNR